MAGRRRCTQENKCSGGSLRRGRPGEAMAARAAQLLAAAPPSPPAASRRGPLGPFLGACSMRAPRCCPPEALLSAERCRSHQLGAGGRSRFLCFSAGKVKRCRPRHGDREPLVWRVPSAAPGLRREERGGGVGVFRPPRVRGVF